MNQPDIGAFSASNRLNPSHDTTKIYTFHSCHWHMKSWQGVNKAMRPFTCLPWSLMDSGYMVLFHAFCYVLYSMSDCAQSHTFLVTLHIYMYFIDRVIHINCSHSQFWYFPQLCKRMYCTLCLRALTAVMWYKKKGCILEQLANTLTTFSTRINTLAHV